jgi:flagellar hook-length control protein FliK
VAPGFETQLATKAQEFLRQGRAEFRVTLQPPSLGRLRVRLEVTENRAVARIVASSPEAAMTLGREREDLFRAFQAQGFESVDVRIEADDEAAARGRHGRGASSRETEAETHEAGRERERSRERPTRPRHGAGVDLFA